MCLLSTHHTLDSNPVNVLITEEGALPFRYYPIMKGLFYFVIGTAFMIYLKINNTKEKDMGFGDEKITYPQDNTTIPVMLAVGLAEGLICLLFSFACPCCCCHSRNSWSLAGE